MNSIQQEKTITKANGSFNYSLCSACGGQCCTNYAGLYIPSDFKKPITKQLVEKLLDSGKVAIDRWEDNPPLYFLRPRHTNESEVNFSWGGICVNWNKVTGCELTEAKRPFQCRMLRPKKNKDGYYNCRTLKKDKASKYECAKRWEPYQEILKQFVNDRYYDRRSQTGLESLIYILTG